MFVRSSGGKNRPLRGWFAGALFLVPVVLLAAGLTGLNASFAAPSHQPPATSAASQKLQQTSCRRPESENTFAASVRPFLRQFCLGCHSARTKRAGLDLERFTGPETVRRDLKPWQGVAAHLEVGDMPPNGSPQPTDAEKRRVIAWVRALLRQEALATAGDPGDVPVRRLSNAEYNATIRDLTGVDMQPAREFPVDGAAGEGFTNAAESLTDITPTLLTKYLGAAHEIAEHAVLLPDGFRFDAGKTRRDWTDASTARLRAFYAAWAPPDGRLDFAPYLAATVRRRADLASGKLSIATFAAREKLNAKYLALLWKLLAEPSPAFPLKEIQDRWRSAAESDVPALAADIAARQASLWQTVRVGSYVRAVGKGYAESMTRQMPSDPVPGASQPVRLMVKLAPAQNAAVLWLATRDIAGDGGKIVWQNPRLEALGKPTLFLRDYTQYGRAFEVDYPALFANTARYLDATVEAVNSGNASEAENIAIRRGLNGALLSRWIALTEVWSFVKGPTRSVIVKAGRPPMIPPASLLGQWQQAASDPARRADAAALAAQVQGLLSGPRPAAENAPNRAVFDLLVSTTSPLVQGVDPGLLPKLKPEPGAAPFGLPESRFGGSGVRPTDLIANPNSVTEIRLPAALLAGREFVAEARLLDPSNDRAVQVQALVEPGGRGLRWDGGTTSPLVVAPDSPAFHQIIAACNRFRAVFPLFTCFPAIIPNDEVVSLKMFHRDDEPLQRLFLDPAQTRALDRLWAEHRFVSQQAVAEQKYLPLFIGFVTQDQPKEMVAFFEGLRPEFDWRAAEFKQTEAAAVPKQWEALNDFTARAYRRPLAAKERGELRALYHSLCANGSAPEEAFRALIARVLVSPEFLFRIERRPVGTRIGAASDWEMATRLSYFLWSSQPDAELRRAAAAGRLHTPAELQVQARRMLREDRVRSLAVEFGAQWLHVRGFDALNDKNERLFPTFDADLRRAIYEETVLFFQNLFQSDRPAADLLNADYTFLNEPLAKHYGIPGVVGSQWRRVEQVQRYGRGGILGLATVQAAQSGASRTSPVLRGNWVSETLLGERLPRPPANVPKLPEDESTAGLTIRQEVERHTHDPACAGCHRRIDPFGFAFEKYDPIGRFRDRDLGGRTIDAHATLRDGTQFEGLEGLRGYLMTTRRDQVMHLFCRRLLGYALGRAVLNSDQPLIDAMTTRLTRNGGRITEAVAAIVASPQFRTIRGTDVVQPSRSRRSGAVSLGKDVPISRVAQVRRPPRRTP